MTEGHATPPATQLTDEERKRIELAMHNDRDRGHGYPVTSETLDEAFADILAARLSVVTTERIQIAPHGHPEGWNCNCVGIYATAESYHNLRSNLAAALARNAELEREKRLTEEQACGGPCDGVAR